MSASSSARTLGSSAVAISVSYLRGKGRWGARGLGGCVDAVGRPAWVGECSRECAACGRWAWERCSVAAPPPAALRPAHPSVRRPSAADTRLSSLSLRCCASDSGGYFAGAAAGRGGGLGGSLSNGGTQDMRVLHEQAPARTPLEDGNAGM